MKDEPNFFTKIFGPFGEVIQASLAFIVLITLLMGGPILAVQIAKFMGDRTHSLQDASNPVQLSQSADSLKSSTVHNVADDDISFTDWISKRPVLYDIVVALVIAFFFYWLGKKNKT